MSNVQIVGILNVTPDSYFDGGRYSSVDLAVKRAGELLQEGADIIEIGGESTGPTSPDVSLEEELRRTIPVIRAIHKEYPRAMLSVDTYKSVVVTQAIEAGVTMVNDVTAGRGDKDMFAVLAKTDAKVIIMYAKDQTPRTTIAATKYDDVMKTVHDFLKERKATMEKSGIAASRIILDPGLGHFVSSDPQYSFEIIARLEELRDLGCPLLLSPSRKSFLAGTENLGPGERLSGTIVCSAIAVLHGATFIRTHDVLPVRRACTVAQEILLA
jgi:dihydropteroate synthase